jgi:hypothetical protein
VSHHDQSKTDVHVLLLQGICCFVDLGENACSILVGNRFEEPLANLLNERHRTVKELLEQLKMKKPSVRQQPEVEKLKPQEEAAHQTLVLDPAQRSRLQQQMQQARLLSLSVFALFLGLALKPEVSSVVKSEVAVLLPVGTMGHRTVCLLRP